METDIVGGQAIGCQTALVLSGVTKKAEFETSMTAPTYINYDLANLVEELFPSD
jgi:ribonucleotide monophosphatase NagD (HAD superfamily)